MAESSVFPPVVVNMIAVGEETGQLDTALLRIAESYERQVDRSLKTLTSLIEPLIIVVMAGFVGFLVIAMLLPIFSKPLLSKTGKNLISIFKGFFRKETFPKTLS